MSSLLSHLKETLQTIIEERTSRVDHFRLVLEHVESKQGQSFGKTDKAKALETFKNTLVLGLDKHSRNYSIKTFGDVLNFWVKSSKNEKTKKSRTSFIQLLKNEKIFNKTYLNEELKRVPLDSEGESTNILYIFTLRAHRKIIELDIPETSKTTYLSYISQIEQLTTSYFSEVSKVVLLPSLKNALTIKTYPFYEIQKDVSTCLQFIENNALESNSIKPYRHLLLLQALIHIPIPASALLRLPSPDEQNLCLQYNDQYFHLPSPLLQLWKALGEPEHLFPESLRNCRNPESRIHTTVMRLRNRAKLKTPLTPKILRSIGETYFPQ